MYVYIVAHFQLVHALFFAIKARVEDLRSQLESQLPGTDEESVCNFFITRFNELSSQGKLQFTSGSNATSG